MKSVKKSLIAIAVTTALAGAAVTTQADDAKGKTFDGVVVEGVVVMEQFPAEVQKGSIQVKDDNEQARAQQAKIDSSEAAAIAARALPGKVVKTKLDDENGYLIWEVEVLGDKDQETQLKIDAGNGHLLAIDAGEEGDHQDGDHRDGEHKDGDHEDREDEKHSSWKFWEKNDQDGGKEAND